VYFVVSRLPGHGRVAGLRNPWSRIRPARDGAQVEHERAARIRGGHIPFDLARDGMVDVDRVAGPGGASGSGRLPPIKRGRQ
jgi:hypothetical protein